MNKLRNLSKNEKEIIKGALQAACEGPFFEDWEFQTLIGVDRETVRSVLNDWPIQKVENDDFVCAINGSTVMLLMYPHGRDCELMEYIPGGIDALKKLVEKLYLSKGV